MKTSERAQWLKKVNQEELRLKLANGKHIDKVIDNIEEIEGLDFEPQGDDGKLDYKLAQSTKYRLDALKVAIDSRMKLINKYLPDLSNMAISQEVEHTVSKPIPITVVDAS